MNRIKVLGIGILLSIIFAVTAVPTGETNPGGIDPGISTLVEANGCSCHNIGDGDMNNPNSAVVLNLTMPDNFTAGETYTLILNISGGPNDIAPMENGPNMGGFMLKVSTGTLMPIDDNVWKPEGSSYLTHTGGEEGQSGDGNNLREWSFNWTAPESDSVVAEFMVYGNSVNGNAYEDSGGMGTSGDYWNSGTFLLAGKNAQVSDEFMIFASCDSLILNKGMSDAVERCKAYLDSGADGILIHSKIIDGTEIFDFSQLYKDFGAGRPLLVVPSSYDEITEPELEAAGVNIVIYANHMLRASYPAMQHVAKTILEKNRSKEADKKLLSIKEILNLIPGTN